MEKLMEAIACCTLTVDNLKELTSLRRRVGWRNFPFIDKVIEDQKMFVADLRETVRKCEKWTVDEEFESTTNLLNEENGLREEDENYGGNEAIDEVDGYTGCVRCRRAKDVLDNGSELERVVKALGKGGPKCLRDSVGMEKEWLWRMMGKKK